MIFNAIRIARSKDLNPTCVNNNSEYFPEFIMENSIFKSLTRGVKFIKPKVKRETAKLKEEVKIEDSDEEILEISPPKKKKKLSEAYLKMKESEASNKIRKQHRINVKGLIEKVKPVESFAELFNRYSINDTLKRNILNHNYSQPTAVQMQVLPVFLEKKSLKVVAPTGSGCYFSNFYHNFLVLFGNLFLQEKLLHSLFH